jgi:Mn-containing catalase
MLQQAIRGVEGEIRVAMQYLVQAWGQRGPKKYRDMIPATGVRNADPMGTEPTLAAPQPSGFAQKEQMTAATGVLGAMKHAVTGQA